MKKYIVTFRMNPVEFEVEAENRDDAEHQARVELVEYDLNQQFVDHVEVEEEN